MDNWDDFRYPQTQQQRALPPSPHSAVPSNNQLPDFFATTANVQREATKVQQDENESQSVGPRGSSFDKYAGAAKLVGSAEVSTAIRSLDSWWMGFVAPKGYAGRIGLDANESDRLRRGKLLARALSALLFVCTLATAITFVSFAEAPTITWLIQLGGAFTLVLTLIGLSRLNYFGHVEAAALLTALLLMAVIVAGDLSTDLAVLHSYNWTDVPSWDLLIAPLILVSLTMHRRQAWIIFGIYVAIVLVVVVCVPQSPEVLSADLASGGVSLSGSSAQQHLSLIIDLLWRSLTLALFACLICTTDNVETMRAMRKLDASEELARLRKMRLDEKEEQQRWVIRTAQYLDRALRDSVPFKPDPLPESWRHDANMLSLREQLVLVGHRLKSGQQAEFALNRLEQHAKQLQDQLQEYRDSGGRANEDRQRRIPFNEYLLIVNLQSRLGSVQAEALMSHLRHYLTILAQEEEQCSHDIQTAIGEYVNGNTHARIDPTRKPRRFGQIVSAINFLLDHVQLPPPNRSRGPTGWANNTSNLPDLDLNNLPDWRSE